jgi:hypothetical protein
MGGSDASCYRLDYFIPLEGVVVSGGRADCELSSQLVRDNKIISVTKGRVSGSESRDFKFVFPVLSIPSVPSGMSEATS